MVVEASGGLVALWNPRPAHAAACLGIVLHALLVCVWHLLLMMVL